MELFEPMKYFCELMNYKTTTSKVDPHRLEAKEEVGKNTKKFVAQFSWLVTAPWIDQLLMELLLLELEVATSSKV